ncbi:MAG: transcription-repair coupling factor [Nitratireductor sp.]|nr:transcription-repair coupling factor [Nitratireductor sp.]
MAKPLFKPEAVLDGDLAVTLAGVPEGYKAQVLAEIAVAAAKAGKAGLVYAASDGQHLASIQSALAFYAPKLETLELPAWDCLPYDRVSPSSEVIARRISTLGRLAGMAGKQQGNEPLLLLTTANALMQRNAPRDFMAAQALHLAPGNRIHMDKLAHWLSGNGFERTSTVRERGEFAVRGGIVDLYAPGDPEPLRLDFFGDTLESIRSFDAASQRTTGQLKELSLAPMSELTLDEASISRFRTGYISMFGAATRDDALYQAVSEGRKFAGTEHWLPLFFEKLDTTFDYVAGFHIAVDYHTADAVGERFKQVGDYHEARQHAVDTALDAGAPYKPVPPNSLYMTPDEVRERLSALQATVISPFLPPENSGTRVIDLAGKPGRSFAAERASGVNVFEAVVNHASDCRQNGKKVMIASWSEGARDRLKQVLAEHHMDRVAVIERFDGLVAVEKGRTAFAVLPVEEGFEVGDLAVIAEQDILGDRLVRRSGRKRKASDFIAEASALSEGDIVVHAEHGIARFAGLRTIEAMGAPHDCLELRYAGDDKLYLPVENIELLSRYGSGDTEVQLDKLGGVAWQARKAKLKKRLLEIAGQLIKTAAERTLRTAERMLPPEGLYDEFVTRFPYDETEDQLSAIESVLDDLAAGTPMDRLICGDVGFGKTEVALRAAFVAAMCGRQVAVVVPTTLLARQHYKTFAERFRGLPLNVRHASRLVSAKELAETRKGIADGTVDIVIGTHALLADSIRFDRLGLLVIDEEQRFGVKHKEKLKELKSDVHVLTLSATPIPRTLQLALTGVRELSLIATAPVDRLAVRTFISPFDPLIVREALLRERYRGGQSFYVCPRIADLGEQKEFLDNYVPELKVAVAHGQMPPGELDDIMNAFYEGQYDVLLSTTIVESGLDIPTANTLIIHRADMFGLAQLYQLRGRVGRSKTRAYAIFTLPTRRLLTANAERRLKVLQSLDTIGAGFELASHDLDIRGGGNLLGEEQSGHIREVGFELYQQMLEEAVAELKDGGEEISGGHWSPQINVGTPVLIPESFVPDLQLRMGLYRRLADLREPSDIDAFGAELIDRFGPLPEEVHHLLKIVFVKGLCLKANVEKLDAGPKGAVITFREKQFSNPAALIGWIGEQSSLAKIRPDQSIVLQRDWDSAEKRLKGAAVIMTKLAQMAQAA